MTPSYLVPIDAAVTRAHAVWPALVVGDDQGLLDRAWGVLQRATDWLRHDAARAAGERQRVVSAVRAIGQGASAALQAAKDAPATIRRALGSMRDKAESLAWSAWSGISGSLAIGLGVYWLATRGAR